MRTLALLLATVGPAAAAPTHESPDLIGLTVAVEAGLAVGLDETGFSGAGEIELGYLLPLPDPVGRDLEVFFATRYANPTASGKVEPDPRLPGDGVPYYSIDQQQLQLGGGVRYRILVPVDLVRPHVSLGLRAWLLHTETTGDAGGEPFGKTVEEDTAVGPEVSAGVDLFLGPGAVTIELQYTYAGIDQVVLQDTFVSALDVDLGYRFFF